MSLSKHSLIAVISLVASLVGCSLPAHFDDDALGVSGGIFEPSHNAQRVNSRFERDEPVVQTIENNNEDELIEGEEMVGAGIEATPPANFRPLIP